MTTRILNSRIDGLMSFPTDTRIARRLSNQQPTEKRTEGLTHWSTHDSRQNSATNFPPTDRLTDSPLDLQVLSLVSTLLWHAWLLPVIYQACRPTLGLGHSPLDPDHPHSWIHRPPVSFSVHPFCSCIFYSLFSKLHPGSWPTAYSAVTFEFTSGFMAHSLFSSYIQNYISPLITELGFSRSGYYNPLPLT